jgi:hypothetical protein
LFFGVGEKVGGAAIVGGNVGKTVGTVGIGVRSCAGAAGTAGVGKSKEKAGFVVATSKDKAAVVEGITNGVGAGVVGRGVGRFPSIRVGQ